MSKVVIDLTDSDVARFWRYVQQSDEGCWSWARAKRNGYGVMSVNGRPVYAHRISYHLAHGGVPDGLRVLHHCDNPECARPDHLYAGTQADNINDAVQRGRWRGHGRPKTADPTVRFARYREKARARRAMLPKIACVCGCGQMIPMTTSDGKAARYALGHNPSNESTQFAKGQRPWNVGVPMRPDAKAKMIAGKTKRK